VASKSSPNQLAAARKSLLEIERVSRIISRPTSGDLNHIAKGLFGLLLLYFIEPALRVDFRALMTLSEITLEGEFDQQSGERLDDPDQPKRKTLRTVIKRLDSLEMLEKDKVGYSDPRLSKRVILERIPHEGTISWAGAELFVKDRPSGQRPEVFTFKTPKFTIINWQEVRKLLSGLVHSSRVEQCSKQMESSLKLIEQLLEKNKIEEPEVTRKLDEIRRPPAWVPTRLTYLLAATEKTQGKGKSLYILPMLLEHENRKA
jgi:hypothetical protein